MKQKLWRTVQIIFIIAAAIYLTYLIDCITLNSNVKRVFVFFYFVIAAVVLVHLKNKHLKIRKKMQSRVVCGALAVLLLALFQSTIVPQNLKQIFTIQGAGQNSASEDGEIWLTGITADNGMVNLARLQTLKNSGWIYDSKNSALVLYPGKNRVVGTITFEVAGKSVRLRLERNSWSGIVQVTGSAGETNRTDLYTGQKNATPCYLEYQAENRPINVGKKILLNFGAFLVLWWLLEAGYALLRKWLLKDG